MNTKKIIWVLIILALLGALFFAGSKFGVFSNILSRFSDYNQQEEQHSGYTKQEYVEAFLHVVEDKYFSFPEEKTVSFGDNKDMKEQIGKYEEIIKEKEAKLMMEFKDENGITREVYVKKLELNDENISYTLQHYTNYFDNQDLSENTYDFKFAIDKFKKDEYKKETNSGTILISNNNIYVIMSNDDSVESFLKIFKETNEVEGTFLEYLEKNQDVLNGVSQKHKTNEEKTKLALQKIPENIKEFASIFWKEYIILNTKELKQYYADSVWFYAGKEWLEEWSMDANIEKEHKFVEVGKNDLLDAYQSIKAEDFKEDLEGMQKITNDDIELYYPNDLMEICYAENKEDFFSHFKIESNDIIIVVRLDDGKTCSIEGNFLGGEIRFWVIREIDGENKVVVDYTE